MAKAKNISKIAKLIIQYFDNQSVVSDNIFNTWLNLHREIVNHFINVKTNSCATAAPPHRDLISQIKLPCVFISLSSGHRTLHILKYDFVFTGF